MSRPSTVQHVFWWIAVWSLDKHLEFRISGVDMDIAELLPPPLLLLLDKERTNDDSETQTEQTHLTSGWISSIGNYKR